MRTTDLRDPSTLLGRWVLAREIDDRVLGQRTRVDGELLLTEVEPGLLGWQEVGSWHQPTGDVEVTRRLWLEKTDAGEWWVRFEDRRDFHPWSPGAEVVHPCAPDTYRGLVSGSPEEWTIRWEVSGPAKDYTMTTVLRPA